MSRGYHVYFDQLMLTDEQRNQFPESSRTTLALSHCIQLSSIKPCSTVYLMVRICGCNSHWYLQLVDPVKQPCLFLVLFKDTGSAMPVWRMIVNDALGGRVTPSEIIRAFGWKDWRKQKHCVCDSLTTA